MNVPVSIGDKVVVLGSEYIESMRPVVVDINWLSDEYRYCINLLWSNGEESKVYSSDVNKTWMTENKYAEKLLSLN